MQRAISETNRRRKLQQEYNIEHGIDPQTIRKAVTDILAQLRSGGDPKKGKAPMPGEGKRSRLRDGRRRSTGATDLGELPQEELGRLIQTLEEEMHEAAKELQFEYAARLRDEINDLKRELKVATR